MNDLLWNQIIYNVRMIRSHPGVDCTAVYIHSLTLLAFYRNGYICSDYDTNLRDSMQLIQSNYIWNFAGDFTNIMNSMDC